MARRTFLWVAVVAWLGVGAASAVTSLVTHFDWGGGWTLYTPYASRPTLAERLVNASGYVQVAAFPLAAVATAVYLVLLDRTIRRGAAPQGFEVRPAGGTPEA